jgi:hypothetical protein
MEVGAHTLQPERIQSLLGLASASSLNAGVEYQKEDCTQSSRTWQQRIKSGVQNAGGTNRKIAKN